MSENSLGQMVLDAAERHSGTAIRFPRDGTWHEWSYAELGAGFFIRAAAQQRSTHKARLLKMVGRHFEPWRQRHARLGRELRDQVYLLPPTPPAPLM